LTGTITTTTIDTKISSTAIQRLTTNLQHNRQQLPTNSSKDTTVKMCVTNIYVDVYPDGIRKEFRQTSICQFGYAGRPCNKITSLENPPRMIGWDEPSTEYMLTSSSKYFPAVLPITPPRSSGGSSHRRSGGYLSAEEGLRRRDSKRRSTDSKKRSSSPKPKREHRKERIIIVDAPPTPRTPPTQYQQVYTAPNSPVARGRPIIVDERPRPPPRVPSVGAVVGERPSRRQRAASPKRSNWDSPSSSHTSFDLQSEERAKNEKKARRDSRIAELEAEKKREQQIRAHDDAIRNRPAVPLQNRQFLRPVVDQSEPLPTMMGGLRLEDRERRLSDERQLSAEARKRLQEKELAMRLRFEEGN
jgi:hypothetical protein